MSPFPACHSARIPCECREREAWRREKEQQGGPKMSDLTRDEVERYLRFTKRGIPILDRAKILQLAGSWLTLEAKVREQDREIQSLRGSEEHEREKHIEAIRELKEMRKQVARYQKYLKWQGELHVDDRGEVHELRAAVEAFLVKYDELLPHVIQDRIVGQLHGVLWNHGNWENEVKRLRELCGNKPHAKEAQQ